MHPTRRKAIETEVNAILRSGANVTHLIAYLRECFAYIDELEAKIIDLETARAGPPRSRHP